MLPYELQIDSAGSGEEAIAKIQGGKVYDIIFMDHMMPVMDGIETTHIIRGLGYAHPIVALTANAIVGLADMFLENGFDDFLSKPVDIRHLNTILRKFIRDKQPPEVIEAALQARNGTNEKKSALSLFDGITLPGLDIEKGLERYDGNEDVYMKILRSYAASFRSVLETIQTVDEERLDDYRIKVHGIKGASYNIFADTIGKVAESLERASKAGDLDDVLASNPAFIKDSYAFLDNLDALLSSIDQQHPKPIKAKPDDSILADLVAACRLYNIRKIDDAMAELEKYQYPSDGGLIKWLREHIDLMSFDPIIKRFTTEGDA
jgi:CheY-like chemotaxis protein